MMNIHPLLKKQLSLDYCCTEEQLTTPGNVFTEFHPIEGRRRFSGDKDVLLRIAVFSGKLLFCGRGDIIDACRLKYANKSPEWFIEPEGIFELNALLDHFGCGITFLHPFYTSDSPSVNDANSLRLTVYRDDDILQFKGDDRFCDAFAYNKEAPDRIGVAAFDGNTMLGMAGASADGEYLWQIGINVFSEYTGRHVGTLLVSELKNLVLREGKLPFYGTSFSHLASQRIAIASGFKPAWVEITAKQLP